MDPWQFVGTYKVRQGSSGQEAGVTIEEGYTVELEESSSGDVYRIRVRDVPDLVFDPLFWNSDTGSLEGEGPEPGLVIRVSFYKQVEPEPLRVIYGTIIKTDPDSVAAWAADDQVPDNHAPDNHAPDNHAPDSHAPDNHAPDHHASESHAPDTQAAG